MADRNIAQLIRESVKPNPSNVEARQRAWPLVSTLYPEDPYDLKTRKGTWRVFRRERFPVPRFLDESDTPDSDTHDEPGFCAVYLQEGSPKTFFLGATKERPLIDRAAAILSNIVLEQRPLVSRPPRSLNSKNGLSYGLRLGFIIMFFLGLFVALDFVLLPRFGPDVAKGLSIAFSSEIVIENYRSLIRSFLGKVFGPAIFPLINSIYSLVALIVVPILITGIVFEFAGKRADRRRVRDLPEEALEFYYGGEAWQELFRREGVHEDERAKQVLFEKCLALGMKASRREFSDLYEEMKRILRAIPSGVKDIET